MSDGSVEYAEILDAKQVQAPIRRSDYGSNLPTSYMVRVNGVKCWLRVKAICWSNVASLYVVVKGKKLFLMGTELEVMLNKSAGESRALHNSNAIPCRTSART